MCTRVISDHPHVCNIAFRRADQRRKSALETYFVDHQIEHKLNGMLNEMVVARPAQPYSWLARRMRREEAGAAPAVNTVPLMDPAVAAGAVGTDIQKAWGYALCLDGVAVELPAGGAAAGGAAKATGINLSIEPLGAGVLLAIRSC